MANAELEATIGADILNEFTPNDFTQETVEMLKALNTHGLIKVETPFFDLSQ